MTNLFQGFQIINYQYMGYIILFPIYCYIIVLEKIMLQQQGWHGILIINCLRGVVFMTEIVLKTSTLPEPLLCMIRTEKVKVNEANGVISLTPILEIKGNCPLRGLAADSKLTVEKFLAMTHDEKEMPQ